MRRVVITGIGAISPLGGNIATTWKGIVSSCSGVQLIPAHKAAIDDLPVKVAGIIPCGEGDGEYNINAYISGKDQKKMDSFIHLALTAGIQAVEDSGWKPQDEESCYRTGIILSSGIGGLAMIKDNVCKLQQSGARRVSPFFIPGSLINLASGHLAIKYGFQGPNHSIVTACATGAHSIGESARIIRDNDADVMIAGGAESAVNTLGIAGFAAMKALSKDFNNSPEKSSRPWDKARDGFVVGEGGAAVVLEEYEHACKRGAHIYGELIGYGSTCDAYHMTAPSANGGFRAMQIAVKKAGIDSSDIDYINAHSTSTIVGDMMELSAITRLLGSEHMRRVSISSTKSATGHLLGAAGSIEAIFSLLSIRDNIVPPTLNLENPEDDCKGIDLVPFYAKDKKVNIVLSNSFGFGGTNATLIFRKI